MFFKKRSSLDSDEWSLEENYTFIPRHKSLGTMAALQEFVDNKKVLEGFHGFPIEFVKCEYNVYCGITVIYKRKKIPVYIGKIMQQS